MADKAWKAAERRLAKIFGTRRRPLSGGNQGGGRDDSMHEVLYIENKYTSRSSLWTLYRDTRDKAKKEGRVPVLGIQESRAKGVLIVCHSNDLQRVAMEQRKAMKKAKAK